MKNKISVIGLGYVGLPLAVALSKKFLTIGFDKSKKRIKQLQEGIDENGEAISRDLKNKKLKFINDKKMLLDVNIFIICVPTPIKNKKPDLKHLIGATKLVADVLKSGDIVIYESTVYPGTTEEVCCPILEKISLLKFNQDFFVGYSPERINPGVGSKKINDIKKIISASSPNTLKKIKKIYKPIIRAGIYEAKSIKIAESAKIIENTQRDLNIALMNEFSQILNKMNINTNDVLQAAKTKWNFNYYTPGLVGGHCIGIDPYYLAYKAKIVGVNPKVILSGRSVNDRMYSYVFKKIITLKKIKKIAFLGVTFKEDCKDFRNSMPIKLLKKLLKKKFEIDVYDPLVNANELKIIEKIKIKQKMKKHYYDLVIITVPHRKILQMGRNWIKNLLNRNGVIFDLKSKFPSLNSKFSL